MENTKTRYLFSKLNDRVYAFDDELEFSLATSEHPEDEEITEDEAYLRTFVRISKTMEKRFMNYRNLDIMQECYYMMLKRYRYKGLFAPDKPFQDNVRIWWNFAKKSCLYIIRQYTDKHLDNIDIWDIEDNETDTKLCLGKCDEYEIGEHTAGVNDIMECIDKLCNSRLYVDQQLGIYAKCKLQGLTDQQSCIILEIGMPRLYEIRRLLKEYLNLRFDRLV
jgi:hypothetical protein